MLAPSLVIVVLIMVLRRGEAADNLIHEGDTVVERIMVTDSKCVSHFMGTARLLQGHPPLKVRIRKGVDMQCNPGTSIVLRSDGTPRFGAVTSRTVVTDREELIALYIAPSYPCKRRVGVRGGPRERVMLSDSGRHEDWAWTDNRMLMLYRPGDAHSTQLFWRAEDEAFLGWYIDLHEPLRRTPIGFDSRNLVLDILVAPDRSSWVWKDEDDFEQRQENGLPSPRQACVIRAEGEQAVERLTGTDMGLYKEWEGWYPDPSWPLPRPPRSGRPSSSWSLPPWG